MTLFSRAQNKKRPGLAVFEGELNRVVYSVLSVTSTR